MNDLVAIRLVLFLFTPFPSREVRRPVPFRGGHQTRVEVMVNKHLCIQRFSGPDIPPERSPKRSARNIVVKRQNEGLKIRIRARQICQYFVQYGCVVANFRK